MPEITPVDRDESAAPRSGTPAGRGLYWGGMVLAYGLAVGVFGASVVLVLTSPSLWEAAPPAPAPAPSVAPAPAVGQSDWPAGGPAASPASPGERSGVTPANRATAPLPGLPPVSLAPMAFAYRDLRELGRNAPTPPDDLVPTRAEISLPLAALPSFASRLATFPYPIAEAPAEPAPPASLRRLLAPEAAPTDGARALPRTDADGSEWSEQPPRPLPQAALPAEPSVAETALRFAAPLPDAPGHAALALPGGIPLDPEGVGYPVAIAEPESVQPIADPAKPERAGVPAQRGPRQIGRPVAPAEVPVAAAPASPAAAGGVSERAVEGMLRSRLLGR
ncbi:MAG: hypothetical protein U1E59_11210 [Amaricoccus sp.]